MEKDGAAKYHVIRAAGLGVEIRNVGNEGKPLSVGDTAEIHLEGLYLPVPKMAGIYNPGIFTYSGMIAPGVRYEIDGEIHKGTATQYALRNTNKLRFKLESEGELDLTSGKVDEGYMGSRGQYHYNIPEEGLIRNFSAVGIEGLYDVLPDIRLFVEGKKELADDEKNQIKEIMMPAKAAYESFMYNTDAVDTERKDIGVEFASGDEFAKMSYVSYSSGTPFALKGSCKSDDVRTMTISTASNTSRIRFKGFIEPWEKSQLKKEVDYTSTGVRACDISSNGKYDLYDANDIIGKVNTYASDKPYISIIKDGAGVGRVRLLPESTNVLGTMGVISPKGENDINFIFSHIQNKDFKQHIISGAIPHVYFKNYGEDYSDRKSVV